MARNTTIDPPDNGGEIIEEQMNEALSKRYLAYALSTITARALPARRATAVLALAVVVQAVDLHGAHRLRHDAARDPAFHTWLNPFDDPRWQVIAPAYTHLALLPPPQCGVSPVPYEAAIGLTAGHGLTINAGVVARRDEQARARYCETLSQAIGTATLADDTLYVVSAQAAPEVAAVRWPPEPAAVSPQPRSPGRSTPLAPAHRAAARRAAAAPPPLACPLEVRSSSAVAVGGVE